MKLLVICALVGALVFAACGGDDDDDAAGDAARPDGTVAEGFSDGGDAGGDDEDDGDDNGGDGDDNGGANDPPPNTGTNAQATPIPPPTLPAGKTMYDNAPPMTIDQNKRYFATIKMDIGDIRVELFPQDAPQHVNSFVFLAREGFYDGITFHRVIPGFVAQAGDPTGTGRGGPGYTIPDEVNPRKFEDGTLGMAKTAAPNSAGSQWFIDYAPQPNLDGLYTAFGQLVEGRDVLDEIAPRDPASASAPGTVINTIIIEEQ